MTRDAAETSVVHCEECDVVVGEKTRDDFEECPHGNEHCAIGSLCLACAGMSDWEWGY